MVDGVGYTGHVMDPGTGLTYMQQRYYDPAIGRFLSADPVTANANTGSMFNRYNYANNKPCLFTDPDGRAPESIGRAIDHDIRAMARGEMSPEEFKQRQEARGAGGVVGVAVVATVATGGRERYPYLKRL